MCQNAVLCGKGLIIVLSWWGWKSWICIVSTVVLLRRVLSRLLLPWILCILLLSCVLVILLCWVRRRYCLLAILLAVWWWLLLLLVVESVGWWSCRLNWNSQQSMSCALAKVGLTLYHTIQTFNDLEKEAFGKQRGKRRKCWYPAFSPFPTMFATLPKESHLICCLQMLSISTSIRFCCLEKS